jgi:hypothetical protein
MIKVETGDRITLQRKDNNRFVNAIVISQDDNGITIQALSAFVCDTLSWDTINDLFDIVAVEGKDD